MNKILTFLFLLFCIGCTKKTDCHLDKKVLKANDSTISKIKSEKLLLQILNQMKEPELESFDSESYRFMIINGFGCFKSYRINKNSDGYVMTSKSYFTNHETQDKKIDSLGKETKTKISTANWIEIKNSIDALNFWSLPVRIKDNHYLDGTSYAIEGYNPIKNECTNRNYHATGRICPGDSTPYALLFKKITDLKSK